MINDIMRKTTRGLVAFGPVLLTFIALGDAQNACNCEPAYRSVFNDPCSRYQFHITAEKGFVGILKHTIQFGTNGTELDYVSEGGQSVLFPFDRFTADLKIGHRHSVIFLYQPLDIPTKSLLDNDLIVDTVVFPAGTAMGFRYGFSFWRISYLYDLNKDPEKDLAFGLSFQIRNASISFESLDGSQLVINQNIGPVPIFKIFTRFPLGSWWWASEIDGFYADGKYITGSRNDFKGAIYDASLRLGTQLNYIDPFLNLRFLGGGAQGDQNDADARPGSGYTNNWLHTFSLTLGFTVK